MAELWIGVNNARMIFSGRATYCICYKLFDPNMLRVATLGSRSLVLDVMPERDVVSWNSVNSRYLQTPRLSEVDWSNLCDFREFYCTTTAVLDTCRGLHSLTQKNTPLKIVWAMAYLFKHNRPMSHIFICLKPVCFTWQVAKPTFFFCLPFLSFFEVEGNHVKCIKGNFAIMWKSYEQNG